MRHLYNRKGLEACTLSLDFSQNQEFDTQGRPDHEKNRGDRLVWPEYKRLSNKVTSEL